MRTYSEAEVADIIARAAERQAESAREPAREGLTLDEIERLGAEAGLDPADLRAAAAEIDTAGRTLAREASQTKTHVVVERWLDGPLTQAGWEDAVVEMQDAFGADMAAFGMGGGSGEKQIGQAFEWIHTSGLGIQTKVLASPRGDRTRLRMTQLVGLGSTRAEGIIYGSVAGIFAAFLAFLLAAGLDLSSVVGPALVLATLVLGTAVAIPATTALDRRWRAKKLDALGALADRVAPVLVAPGLAEGADPVLEALPEPTLETSAEGPLRDAFERLEGDAEAPAVERRRDRA